MVDEDFYKYIDAREEIELDNFYDDKIEETLKKYNYDYKSLMRELTMFVDYRKLVGILEQCKIKKEEYLNPTYDIFEKVRKEIIKSQI